MSRSLKLNGGFKELLILFFPILLLVFSNYLFLLVEKLYLARLSIQAMEAAISAAYACQVMQVSCIAIVTMVQVWVGHWYGAKEWKSIGPGTWQFIWFSCLSMFVSVTFNLIYGSYYFRNTAVEEIVWPYFYFLTAINFLFPLAATFISFNLGLGKTRLILFTSIGTQLLKILFAYILIFGVEGWIPSLGLLGGAVSTLIAQGSFCLILFLVFLKPQFAELYHTHDWRFKPKLFWDCIQPGLVRGLSRISMLLSWASITHLMTSRGGDYLLALSIGGTISIFLPFLADATLQAQITILSNLLGAKNYHLLWKAFRSATFLAVINITIFAIPLLLFPNFTFQYFFPGVVFTDEVIQKLFLGVWLSFALFTFNFIPISYVLSFKDIKFMLFMGAFNWINGYLLMYIVIEWMNMPAEQFWTVLSLMHGSMGVLYVWRMRWLISRATTQFAHATQTG